MILLYNDGGKPTYLSLWFKAIFICLQTWPEDALQAVATRFLEDIEMSEDERYGCIEMCKYFHTTTRELSTRFLLELERHNYVTPTSYLELINTFKVLLNKKRGYV